MNVKAQNLRFAEKSLPEGWVLTELREVLEVHYGKGLTKSVRNETGTVPVYGSNGKVGYHDVALVTGPCIIIGRKGAAGAVHFSAENCWPIDTTYYTRPPDELSVKYMFYLLGSLNLEELDRSTAIPGLNRDDLYAQQVPVPPLPEQHCIVAEIETQFSRLDAGVAALKRVQAKLRRYKASVLKAACEGRLVPTEAELARVEGREYESGAALLERILAERRVQWQQANSGKRYVEPKGVDGAGLADLPEGWVWATVEQLNPADRSCAYGVLQPGPDVEGGIPLVRVGDIQEGRVATDALKRVAPGIVASYRRTELKGGEVVISLVGAIGRTAVVPESLAGANTARAVGVIPLTPNVSPHWVEIWFRNPSKVADMTGKAHEVARKTLNLEDVRAADVAVPPLAEQHRIVAEVERRLSVAQEVESTVAASLRRAERLRQSILKQAFAGRLTSRAGV